MLECVRTPRGQQRCGLILQAVDSTKRRLMLRLTVVRTAKGPLMVVMTPPNALLPQGFSLTPDKAKAVTVPFNRCLPRACQAVIKLTDEFVSELGAAATAGVHFVAGSGRQVNFKIPTNGFSAGYAALQTADAGQVAAPAAAAPPKPRAESTAPSAPAQDAPAAIDASPDHGTQPTGNPN